MQSDLHLFGVKLNILKHICVYQLATKHPLENFAAMRSEWELSLLVVVYETHIQKKTC